MSQKQACAIFATSFLAGLLVTAMVFQPFSSTPADTPYFGFPDETADRAALNNQVESKVITVSQSSPPQITQSLVLSNLPNEFAESFSNTLRDHLLTLGEIPTDTASFPQAMMLSTEEILSLENLSNGLIMVLSLLLLLMGLQIPNRQNNQKIPSNLLELMGQQETQ